MLSCTTQMDTPKQSISPFKVANNVLPSHPVMYSALIVLQRSELTQVSTAVFEAKSRAKLAKLVEQRGASVAGKSRGPKYAVKTKVRAK